MPSASGRCLPPGMPTGILGQLVDVDAGCRFQGGGMTSLAANPIPTRRDGRLPSRIAPAMEWLICQLDQRALNEIPAFKIQRRACNSRSPLTIAARDLMHLRDGTNGALPTLRDSDRGIVRGRNDLDLDARHL